MFNLTGWESPDHKLGFITDFYFIEQLQVENYRLRGLGLCGLSS